MALKQLYKWADYRLVQRNCKNNPVACNFRFNPLGEIFRPKELDDGIFDKRP